MSALVQKEGLSTAGFNGTMVKVPKLFSPAILARSLPSVDSMLLLSSNPEKQSLSAV